MGFILARFFEGLRNFGWFEHMKSPLGTPLDITELMFDERNIYLHPYLEIVDLGRYALPGVTVQEM